MLRRLAIVLALATPLLIPLAPSAASASAANVRDLTFVASDGVKLHAAIGGTAPLSARPLIIEDSPYAPAVTMPFGRAYNYIQLQWRGTGQSGGRWSTTGSRDQRDLSEFVGWACRQSFSNGHIGLYGFSASAIAVYNAMHLRLPCVDAAALMAGTVDLYRDLLYVGGIPAVAPGLYVYGAVAAPWLQSLTGRIQNQPLTLTDSAAGFAGAFSGVASHMTEDAFWQDRTFRGDADHIPILADTSFYDVEPRGPFLAYKATRDYGSHLLVLGAHDGVPAGNPGPFPQYTRWFDHYVRGIDNGIDREPPVSVYLSNGSREQLQAGHYTKIDATDWPLPGTEWTRLYLSKAGTLVRRPDAARSTKPYAFLPSDSLETDPHTTAVIGPDGVDQLARYVPATTNMDLSRAAALTYTTPPLAAPLDVVGPGSLDLFASSLQNETDLVAVVADVWPDGHAYAVATGQLRTSFPGVNLARSLTDPATGDIVQPYNVFAAKYPSPVGATREYHIELLPVGNHFAAGHRIRLYILGTPFDAQPAPAGVNTVSMGGATPSRLILPTYKRR